MATVTGFLRDFTGLPASLAGFHAEIIFTPSGPAIAGAVMVVTKPIIVPVSPVNGAWTAELGTTEGMFPASWLGVKVRWLNPTAYGPDAGYSEYDFTDWKLHVPPEGGEFSKLVSIGSAAWNPLLVFWQPTEPDPWPVGAVWFHTLTGEYFRNGR